jgi:hypothetical protein
MDAAALLQRHTWIARTCAFVGGGAVAFFAILGYWLAGYADDAVDAGHVAAADALDSELAASWIERAALHVVGGSPDGFRRMCIVALLAGIVAAATAFPRRPLKTWQEWVWALAALVALAPNLVWGWWFTVWAFSGSAVAGAAVVHYLARRDDLVRRAQAGAVQAGVYGAEQARGWHARWRQRR